MIALGSSSAAPSRPVPFPWTVWAAPWWVTWCSRREPKGWVYSFYFSRVPDRYSPISPSFEVCLRPDPPTKGQLRSMSAELVRFLSAAGAPPIDLVCPPGAPFSPTEAWLGAQIPRVQAWARRQAIPRIWEPA